MEKTLLIIKPSGVHRGLVGEVISRFERKGLRLAGTKMMRLNDDILNVHYAHLKEKPFFESVKKSMMSAPVIVMCWAGVDAAKVVRNLTGCTNGREAAPGTIRGDFSVSAQENIVHTSDSPQSAKVELSRFFSDAELFDYKLLVSDNLYSEDELER